MGHDVRFDQGAPAARLAAGRDLPAALCPSLRVPRVALPPPLVRRLAGRGAYARGRDDGWFALLSHREHGARIHAGRQRLARCGHSAAADRPARLIDPRLTLGRAALGGIRTGFGGRDSGGDERTGPLGFPSRRRHTGTLGSFLVGHLPIGHQTAVRPLRCHPADAQSLRLRTAHHPRLLPVPSGRHRSHPAGPPRRVGQFAFSRPCRVDGVLLAVEQSD